MLREIGFYLLL